MELKSREDVAAPIGMVFRAISDFDGFEHAALRRGVEIERLNDAPGTGRAWQAAFEYRGRKRDGKLEITEMEPPNRLVARGAASGIGVEIRAELVALSRQRTRMEVTTTLKPRTISGKLLMQALKLGRAGLQKRYVRRLADFAARIERRRERQQRRARQQAGKQGGKQAGKQGRKQTGAQA